MVQTYTTQQRKKINKFCTKLVFDYCKKLRMSQTITYVILNVYYDKQISLLSQNITYLYIDTKYYFPKLPSNIKYLILTNEPKHKITLPYSVTHLSINSNMFKLQLHTNVTHLEFQFAFNQFVIIPYHITHLTFGGYFNQQITLPQNITHLTFGEQFNQKIIIPLNVTHLTFGAEFNQKIIIPFNVTHLTFGAEFNQKIAYSNKITHLTFGCQRHSVFFEKKSDIILINT